MYEIKKIGKVFTSKSVGTGPSSYGKRIYRGRGLTEVEKHCLRPQGQWDRHILWCITSHFNRWILKYQIWKLVYPGRLTSRHYRYGHKATIIPLSTRCIGVLSRGWRRTRPSICEEEDATVHSGFPDRNCVVLCSHNRDYGGYWLTTE